METIRNTGRTPELEGRRHGLARGAIALAAALLLAGRTAPAEEPPAPRFEARPLASEAFLRGDANLDGIFSLADVFSILRFNFLGGPMECLDAADVDDSGRIDQTDALFLFDSIFNRRRTPPEPFQRIGRDTSDDRLGCVKGLVEGPDANLQVLGLGAASPCNDPNAGADLEFIHTLARVFVYPGQQSVRVPIFLTSVAGRVEGFTLSLYAPPEQVHLEQVDFSQTVLEPVVASGSAWVNNFLTLRPTGYLASTVVLSSAPPFETLPSLPYPGRVVANLELDVAADVPVGSEIRVEFRDTPAEDGVLPPIRNELSRDGGSQSHRACGLTLVVVSEADVFLRGDANRNWEVDLSDAVTIISALFSQRVGTAPCLDSADVDDDGRVRLTDALLLLNFLFRGGSAPAHPFPVPGIDTPAGDSLSCLPVR